MLIRHRSVAFEFFLLPVSLIFTAIFRPKQLFHKAEGDVGVVYSLAATVWTMFFLIKRSIWEAEKRNDEVTLRIVSEAMSMTFSLELMTIPFFAFYLILFAVAAWATIIDVSDRRNLLSLALILFWLANAPFAVAQTFVFPEFLSEVDPTISALRAGHAATWIYLLVPVVIGFLLYRVNARELAPNSNPIRLAIFFIAVVVLVVAVAWPVEIWIARLSFVTLAVYSACESTMCFVTEAPKEILHQFK